jgi:hypothetical protein
MRPGLQYYDPLGLPLCSARLRLRLIRAALPRPGPHRRVSRVPLVSLSACCAPYPAGAKQALWNKPAPCCLRREMTGSAPGLFLCRGCRLHFMLRPADWLPTHGGLSTSRSGSKNLSFALEPATRRSSAYRDRTCTGGRRAARPREHTRIDRSRLEDFTAHHRRSVSRDGARSPVATATSEPSHRHRPR